MKVAELLRKLADVIAAAEGDVGSETGQLTQPNRAELTPAEADQTDHSDGNVFVPPLQAKMEILKKSVGMDNVYDNEGADEVAVIKKNAGLNATQQEAVDDEPFDQ